MDKFDGLGIIAGLIATENGNEITKMERKKQIEFCSGNLFPIKNLPLEQLEAEGFVFKDFVDNDFIEVNIPDGWKIVPDLNSSLRSLLIDKNGNNRISFVHKYNSYDRYFYCGIYRTDEMISKDKIDREYQAIAMVEQKQKKDIYNAIPRVGNTGNKFIFDTIKKSFIDEKEFILGSNYIFVYALNEKNAQRKLDNYFNEFENC